MSDLTALAKFTSVDLTWSAIEGHSVFIINYEVTYRVSNGTLNTINTTDLNTTFSIASLSPRTTVSGLSVSAYNRIGRGEATTIADQITLENCELCTKLINPLLISLLLLPIDSCYLYSYSE